MKQKVYALRSWLTLLLLCLMGSAWGQTEASIDFSQQGFANGEKISSGKIDENISYLFDKASGSVDPAYYNTGTSARVYGSNVLSIIPGDNVTITSIAFTYGSGNSKNLFVDSEEIKDTWTGSSDIPVEFKISGTSGHARVKVITVTYQIGAGVEKAATPVFTPESGTLFEDVQEITIATATDDASIYYTTDGATPEVGGASTTLYTAPFTITETTTVKAIAVKDGMENSGVATAIYNKVEILKGIAGLKTAITSTDNVNVAAVLTDVVVTAVSGNTVLLEDAEAGITLFVSGHGLKVGNVINGAVTGTAKLYSGLRELTSIDLSGATVTEGGVVPVTELSLSEIAAEFDKYESMRVKIADVTITKAFVTQNSEITQGETSMVLRANTKTITVDAGTQADVFGYPGLYNSDQQIRVLTQEDIIVKEAGKTTATLTFDASTYSLNIGEVQTIAATTNSTAAVEYVSSDESVATVDAVSGEVTAVAAGTVTITARVAENDEYTEAEASYTLTVVDPNAEIEGVALVASSGGNYYAMLTEKGSKTNTLAAKAVDVVNGKAILTDDVTIDQLAWLIDEANGTITTSGGQYLTGTTSGTNLTLGSTATKWTFGDGMWKIGTRSFIYSSADDFFKNYAISNIGKNGYAETATYPMPISSGYVRNVTAENFGTICLPNNVSAADYTGVEFYTVAGKRTENGVVNSVVLAEATELTAGVPYIFRATTDKLVAAYSGNAVTVAASENGLHGTLTAVNVAQDADDTALEGMYILTGNKLQLCGKGCWLGANRAYINMTEVPEADASVKGLEIGFDGLLTGVETAKNNAAAAGATVDVYTLNGICVRTQVRAAEATNGLPKGIYLVNGEKVIVK